MCLNLVSSFVQHGADQKLVILGGEEKQTFKKDFKNILSCFEAEDDSFCDSETPVPSSPSTVRSLCSGHPQSIYTSHKRFKIVLLWGENRLSLSSP